MTNSGIVESLVWQFVTIIVKSILIPLISLYGPGLSKLEGDPMTRPRVSN